MFCPSRCVCIFQINNFSVIMGDFFFLNNKQIDMIGQVMQIEFSQIFIGLIPASMVGKSIVSCLTLLLH